MIKNTNRLCGGEVAQRLVKVSWEMASDRTKRNALLKISDFMVREIELLPRLLKKADDMDELGKFFVKYGDEAAGLLKNIAKKYGDDILEGIWHNKAYSQEVLRNIFKDLDTISEVKGAKKLAKDIAKCDNLGRAFEAEVAAKRVNDVAEVSKDITTPIGKTDIDVLLKNGTMIECKTGRNWPNEFVGSEEYKKLKEKIEKMQKYAPDKEIRVIFKQGVSLEIREWLENTMKVIVEIGG